MKMKIRSYRGVGTRDIAAAVNSKAGRKILPQHLHGLARRKLNYIAGAKSLADLNHPGLALHRLIGDRRGQYAVKINDQFRICFMHNGTEVFEVEIVDYH